MLYLDGLFSGWTANGKTGVIHDDAGNHYYLNEIRAIFYYRELAKGFEGNTDVIRSLKNELENKLNNLKKPAVVIDWGDVQERYIHPHYR